MPMKSLRELVNLIENPPQPEPRVRRAPARLFEDAKPQGFPRYLFHGTSIDNALMILRCNYMSGSEQDGFHCGVSLSRSEHVAGGFATYQEEVFRQTYGDYYGGDTREFPELHGVVFVFDASKIQQELSEVDHAGDGREEEFRTHGDLRPMRGPLVAILARREEIEAYEDAIKNLLAMEDAQAVSDYGAAWQTAVDSLKNSPILSEYFKVPA